ncbi:MAG: CarD family transcriptional regulator [Blautia sp.]|nr:CarD family transcriptional regulator [Blautia sp.]
MFSTGEYVIYGRAGICRVEGVTTMDMEGVPKDRLYYVLIPDGKKDGTIYTPVDNMKQVLRPVMTKQEAEQLISSLPEIEELNIENEKLREEKYKECIKSCDGTEMFRIIKTIYTRKQNRMKNGKRVTAVDERYMKLAEDNLYAELSMLLGVPREKMVSYISERIENH